MSKILSNKSKTLSYGDSNFWLTHKYDAMFMFIFWGDRVPFCRINGFRLCGENLWTRLCDNAAMRRHMSVYLGGTAETCSPRLCGENHRINVFESVYSQGPYAASQSRPSRIDQKDKTANKFDCIQFLMNKTKKLILAERDKRYI